MCRVYYSTWTLGQLVDAAKILHFVFARDVSRCTNGADTQYNTSIIMHFDICEALQLSPCFKVGSEQEDVLTVMIADQKLTKFLLVLLLLDHNAILPIDRMRFQRNT